MKFRLPARVAALSLAAALALSGCGSSSDDDGATPSPSPDATSAPEPSAADVAALAGVTVDGDAGAEPTLTFDVPFAVSAATPRLVDEGTGAPLEEGQLLSVHFTMYNGEDASRAFSTWQEGASTDSIFLGDPALGVINDVLSGTKVGARALVANPAPGNDGTVTTSIMLLEVADATTLPTRAEGDAVTPAEGLPTVTLADDGAPSIEIPDGYEAPAEIVVQTLITGTGPVVEESQTITAHYSGWTLDGESFDSSWERGTPMTRPLQAVIPGWTQGLAGQTVGSQVLLVIPTELAYGPSSDENTHPLADKPLIFVVDILDAR